MGGSPKEEIDRMTYRFQVECPKCRKVSEVGAEKLEPLPVVNCGDCLFDLVEIVQMKVVKVEEITA